jgi:hypothetical protein
MPRPRKRNKRQAGRMYTAPYNIHRKLRKGFKSTYDGKGLFQVRTSPFRGDGYGLFVVSTIPAHTMIGWFNGLIHSQKPKANKECLLLCDDTYMEVDVKQGIAALVNSVSPGEPAQRLNCEIVSEFSSTGGAVAWLTTTRNIYPGEELLTRYGTEYPNLSVPSKREVTRFNVRRQRRTLLNMRFCPHCQRELKHPRTKRRISPSYWVNTLKHEECRQSVLPESE